MTGEVFKILALCLIGAAVSLTLRPKAGEYSFLIALSVGIIVLGFVFKGILAPINSLLETLNNYGVDSEYFGVALKAVGLAYVTDFIAEACHDAGQDSLASKANLAGKAAIFIMSVPILMTVLNTAVGFLK